MNGRAISESVLGLGLIAFLVRFIGRYFLPQLMKISVDMRPFSVHFLILTKDVCDIINPQMGKFYEPVNALSSNFFFSFFVAMHFIKI